MVHSGTTLHDVTSFHVICLHFLASYSRRWDSEETTCLRVSFPEWLLRWISCCHVARDMWKTFSHYRTAVNAYFKYLKLRGGEVKYRSSICPIRNIEMHHVMGREAPRKVLIKGPELFFKVQGLKTTIQVQEREIWSQRSMGMRSELGRAAQTGQVWIQGL